MEMQSVNRGPTSTFRVTQLQHVFTPADCSAGPLGGGGGGREGGREGEGKGGKLDLSKIRAVGTIRQNAKLLLG